MVKKEIGREGIRRKRKIRGREKWKRKEKRYNEREKRRDMMEEKR